MLFVWATPDEREIGAQHVNKNNINIPHGQGPFTKFAQKVAAFSGRPSVFIIAILVVVVWGAEFKFVVNITDCSVSYISSRRLSTNPLCFQRYFWGARAVDHLIRRAIRWRQLADPLI